MNFEDLTGEEAEQWLEYVKDSGPCKLRDLARWVQAADGPMELFDGTVKSLKMTWPWFRDFVLADLKQYVPPGAIGPRLRAFGLNPPTGPIFYAADVFTAYIFEVIAGALPEAAWALKVQKLESGFEDAQHHKVGVVVNDWWTHLSGYVDQLCLRSVKGNPQARTDDRLYELMVMLFPIDGLVGKKRPSLLLDALASDPAIVDVPIFGSRPEAEPAATPERTREEADVDAVALIALDGSLEDPSEATPLDEQKVAAFLTRFGIETTSGVTVTVTDLQTVGIQLQAHSGHLVAETFVAGGRLRSVAFEPVNEDGSAWKGFITALRQLAVGLHARVALADGGDE